MINKLNIIVWGWEAFPFEFNCIYYLKFILTLKLRIENEKEQLKLSNVVYVQINRHGVYYLFTYKMHFAKLHDRI